VRIAGLIALGIVLALGAPAGAVVGGTPAGSAQFPWAVRVGSGCDGSLVAPRAVLTAAHCVVGVRSVKVRAGAADLGDATTVPSTAITVAPGYRVATQGSDWAVITLAHPLDLPVLPLTPSTAYDRGSFVVVGWGAAHEGGGQQRYLRWATVPYVPDARCVDAYRDDGYVADDMICAGYLSRGGVDACQGDSGGPLVHRDATGGWVQVGIVSYGYGCGRRGYPGVYTQVSTYAAEIRTAVDGAG
jgi:secreted trypsin-like serine protease